MNKKKLNKVLGGVNIQELKDKIKKANNPFSVKIMKEKSKIKIVELDKELKINDIIQFDNQGTLEKAVVTGKGRHGVTCRNNDQRILRIRYKDIENFIARKLNNGKK